VQIGGGSKVQGKIGTDLQKVFGKLLSDRSVRAKVRKSSDRDHFRIEL